MASESTLTTRKFLDGIFEQIRPHADNPEEFASEWEGITGELDSRVKNLECFMSKRDDLARELILLMRTQFANSYLFDDLWLQYSQGCSVLSDYAELLSDPELDRNKGGVWGGHKCDGIHWTWYEKRAMPKPLEEKKLDFHGSISSGWPYCSCLDHALSNLICKVWGFSGFTDTNPDRPKTDWLPSADFRTAWWKDSSMYLSVLLCFGINILNDPILLKDLKDEQEIDIDIIPEPKEKLRAVLNAKSIRSKLWARIQDQIEKRAKEDGVKPPQQQ